MDVVEIPSTQNPLTHEQMDQLRLTVDPLAPELGDDYGVGTYVIAKEFVKALIA